MIPKKRQSSGIPHLSEVFVAAKNTLSTLRNHPPSEGNEMHVFRGRDGQGERFSGSSRLSGLFRAFGPMNEINQTKQMNQINQPERREATEDGRREAGGVRREAARSPLSLHGEQAFDGNVFVNRFPVDTDASTNQAPLTALFGCGVE
jgi:hypothetical protein